MNVFGGTQERTVAAVRRGKRGPAGKPGPSGIHDLCKWPPDFILQEFRKTESCSYHFPVDGSGFVTAKDSLQKFKIVWSKLGLFVVSNPKFFVIAFAGTLEEIPPPFK